MDPPTSPVDLTDLDKPTDLDDLTDLDEPTLPRWQRAISALPQSPQSSSS
jgi:hypothetical protein